MELVVLFFLFFTLNNYLEEPESKIGNADGLGYYDYLPSIFIRHDINRKDADLTANDKIYEAVTDPIRQGLYVSYKDQVVNKCPIGTAILQFPFFYAELITHSDDEQVTGYEHPFQTAVFHAVVFYFFMGLIFLKLILREYQVKNWIIFFIQLLLAIGTNALHYVYYEPSFSHIYSFFAINVFLYCSLKYFKTGLFRYFLFVCIAFAMIANIRQINILVAVILPFLAGDFDNLKSKIINLFVNFKFLILGVLFFFGVVFIQFYAWYLQTGDWLVYSYQNESFDFAHPHFIDILFSYKKGLFLYTPVVFVAFLSLFWMLFKKKFYLFATWMLFFVFITYVLSSWWSWFFGCSFGLRAYIDFYAIFFIPFALFLNQIKSWVAITVLVITGVFIPVNVIQSYQYKRYILHWIDMNEEMYWKVFLKTHPKYDGLVWLEKFDFENQVVHDSLVIGDLTIAKDEGEREITFFTDSIKDFAEVSTIVLTMEDEFEETYNERIELRIEDPNDTYYYLHEPYLVQFAHKSFGKEQMGYYSYKFDKMSLLKNGKLHLKVKYIENELHFKNVKLLLYK